MKGTMRRLQRLHRALTQTGLTLLLVIQTVGGGAITLAHARDLVTAPATVEAQHDARCPVLHDALRCALCHYASAQVVVQRAVVTPPARPTRPQVPATRLIVAVSSAIHRTAPARAPPALLS
ncbi:MAG TPA: hypothetical protein VGQ18_03195 [Gemmatimonadales bacterium]|jgi:hypothetical protein|nr:hypothetical protein [Gemmatimonadales bacterium]